jgi:hypothetical protein
MDCAMMPPPSEPSWRKPAGMLLILALIAGWTVLIASASHIVGGWPWYVQAVFYTVAGIAWIWILPLKRLLHWMELGRWS